VAHQRWLRRCQRHGSDADMGFEQPRGINASGTMS